MLAVGNDLGGKVAADIITEVFKTCFHGFLKADEWLLTKNKKYDFLGLAARRYREHLEARYNQIRIFGMDKPVSLRSIYVRLSILEKITAMQRVSIEELEKHFDRDRRRFGIKREIKDANIVADELQKFIVLGKPGAGKTTLLKSILLQSLDGKFKKKRIPIFLSLKDFSDSKKSLINYIVKQFDICRFPDAEPFIIRMLEEGKCQLLLDGLDEVGKGKKEENTIKHVQDFSDKYRNNQFILSCRIAAYNYRFDNFVNVEIADFDDGQIRAFIKNWFMHDAKIAELCWERLSNSEPIKELATIPLLLTLLCLAFEQSLEFPQNRAELYKEAIDALLKKWDSTRGIMSCLSGKLSIGLSDKVV